MIPINFNNRISGEDDILYTLFLLIYYWELGNVELRMLSLKTYDITWVYSFYAAVGVVHVSTLLTHIHEP